MVDISGKIVDGYIIRRHLGSSAGGKLYAAEDEATGISAVLKIIESGDLTPEIFKDFQQKRGKLESVSSPYYAPILSLKCNRSSILLVSRHTPHLSDTPDWQLQLSDSQLAPAFGVQLIQACRDAVSAGTIAFGYSPGSISYEAGTLKIVDFPLLLADLPVSANVYLPPEWHHRKIWNEQSYVYQCGAILYFALLGSFPKATRGTSNLTAQILNGKIPSLIQQRQDLCPGWIDVLMRAIQDDYGNRFESLEAMESSLMEIELQSQSHGHSGSPAAMLASQSRQKIEDVLDSHYFDDTQELSAQPSSNSGAFFDGQVIGNYRLNEQLGQDDRGNLYRATHAHTNNQATLRILPKNAIPDNQSRRRFISELEASSVLKHSGVTRILEILRHQGHDVICSEWVEGQSLKQQLTVSTLPIETVITYAIQIAETLQRGHQSGIIHGDLKPSNLLLATDGTIKIRGFAVSSLINRESIANNDSVLGNYAYLAPEILLGKAVDHRCDVFSFGVILYEMLCCHNPFQRQRNHETIYSILMNERAELPSSQEREDPPELRAIVEKCMEKDPADRFQSMQDVLEALLGFRSNEYHQNEGHELSNSSDIMFEFKSIDALLEQRQKIDQLIAAQHTKNVVVMFCDLAGSTSYFETRGDLEGRAMVQKYYGIMFPIIRKNEGRVIKTIGDGILSSFSDTEQACKCAEEMQKSAAWHNRRCSQQEQFAIRVALHYGKAVIEKRDIFGDVVNAAARLEALARPGEIIVSDIIVAQVASKEQFRFAYCGEEQVKGKSSPMIVYKLDWNGEQQSQLLPEQAFPTEPQKPIPEPTDSSPEANTSTPMTHEVHVVDTGELPLTEPVTDSQAGIQNPYMNRVKIKHIGEFYGRTSELARIFNRIGASRPQSVSLVGERRIGKSSLLNHICQPSIRQQYLAQPESYAFVYIDWQEKGQLDPRGYITVLYEALRTEFGGRLEINAEPTYAGLKKVISSLEQKGYKLILVFDEFECVTRNDRFDREFYSFCRSLANNHNLAYVVASGSNLQSLCYSEEIADSPFFNIFSNITLSQFTHNEALELIVQPAKKFGVFMDPHVPFILDVAGYHPFFIQISCAVLFDYLGREDAYGETLYDLIKDEIWDEARMHLQQVWDSRQTEEREVLYELSHRRQTEVGQTHVVKELMRGGYVKLRDGRATVFSILFEDMILQNYHPNHSQRRSSWFNFRIIRDIVGQE